MGRCLATNALAWALAASASCGPGGTGREERVASSASAIQGGKSDPTHTFAVGVCGGAAGGPAYGNACQVLCSGTLIAPNLVVTARHCFDSVSSKTVDCSADSFGPLVYPVDEYFVTTAPDIFEMTASWHTVSQIITPTPTAFCGNDVALLILGTNVPSSEAATLATPEIWYPIDAPQFATTETAIGYGADAPDDSASAGTRRILEKIGIECVPGDSDPKLACAPVATSGIAPSEFSAGDGPCDGDSGSSAYEQNSFNDGTFLSLGVLSRGGTSGDTCAGSIYTQLYPWQSLILETATKAASLGGYALPAWTTAPPMPKDAGTPRDADQDASAPARDAATVETSDGAAGGSGDGMSGGCTVPRGGRGSDPARGPLLVLLGLAAAGRRRRLRR